MKINILVVDNDKSLLEVLLDFLAKDDNFNVLTAPCGTEALDIAKNTKIDLVIVDLKMPEMSGAEMLSVMHSEIPEIKSIILTGHSGIDSYIESMEIGAHEYLNKPVDLFLLKKVINKLLSM
jgi:DNA-binding NtrC family response regulator